MKTPHKHADLIKAWADGAKIEMRLFNGKWDEAKPSWDEGIEYRVKPEPKPDVVSRLKAEIHHGFPHIYMTNTSTNLKLTFDYETGKLKAEEVIA